MSKAEFLNKNEYLNRNCLNKWNKYMLWNKYILYQNTIQLEIVFVVSGHAMFSVTSLFNGAVGYGNYDLRKRAHYDQIIFNGTT